MIESKIVECIRDKERVDGHLISNDAISLETGVSVSIIERLRESHISPIDDISIGEIERVGLFFNVPIEEFVFTSTPVGALKDVLAKKIHSQEFKRLMQQSEYYSDYLSVPTLIDEIAKLLDIFEPLTVGVKKNVNLKRTNEAVYVRFTRTRDGKIKINNVLFGSSIKANDDRTIYLDIYNEYMNSLNKDYIENDSDVQTLITSIKKYI